MLKFSIRYEGHGWLWVSIQTDSFQHEFPASYVPYDSVGQLADALLHLLAYPTASVTVVWNSEPIEHEFRFTRTSSNSDPNELAHLQIVIFPDERRMKDAPGDIVGTVRLPLNRMVKVFWRTLKCLAQDEQFRCQWEWTFPNEQLERIAQILTEQARSEEAI